MRFRFSIRDLLWLTLAVALTAGWLVDHRRSAAVSTPTAPPPTVVAAPVWNHNPGNETVTGYNAKGLPTFTGPRGGQYHYSANGSKVYDKRSKITLVAAPGIE